MRFEIFTNFRSLLSATHIVVSWFVVVLFGIVAVYSTILSVEFTWSMGPFHPAAISHTMPEEDFANLWSAGHLIRTGRLDWIYSSHLFDVYKRSLFGPTLRTQDWIYPPTVFLLGVPISYLPLVTAYFLWDGVSLAIAIIVLRWAKLSWPVLLIGILGPATWRSLLLGQYGTVTGALVIAGLLTARSRPIWAGIMLGLVTLKPQQGVIVPVAWVAARYWRAILGATATFGILALAICLWLGTHAWWLFFTQSSAMARGILILPPPQDNINTGVSVFWMCRTMGSDVSFADHAQMVAAVIAVGLTFLVWRKDNVDPIARVAFTVCASLMVTPYGYTCDMVAFSIVVVMMIERNHWRLRIIDVLLWFWPFFCTIVTVDFKVLLTPFIVVIAAAIAWHKMFENPVDSECSKNILKPS